MEMKARHVGVDLPSGTRISQDLCAYTSSCKEAGGMHMIIALHATALFKIIKIIIKDSTNVCHTKAS